MRCLTHADLLQYSFNVSYTSIYGAVSGGDFALFNSRPSTVPILFDLHELKGGLSLVKKSIGCHLQFIISAAPRTSFGIKSGGYCG